MTVDRAYQDKDTKELTKAHQKLWRSLVSCKGFDVDMPINIVARDMLNLLLEYERELAFREMEGG